MRVKNTHELGGTVELPSLGLIVGFDDVIDVDDETAAALLAQGSNWTLVEGESDPVAPDPPQASTEGELPAAPKTRGGKR